MLFCVVDVQGDRYDVRDDAANYETPVTDQLMRLGSTKSRLFIDCVRPSDLGIYTCVAETPTERITITTVLRVGQFRVLLLAALSHE